MTEDNNDRIHGTVDLPELFSRDPWGTDALDLFVGRCLTSGGIWSDPRTSDGIPSIVRVLERGSEGLGVCARIYEIDDQSLHTFWLEIKRDAVNARIAWFLYFDVIETSKRRAENAVNSHDQPEDIEWRAKVSGEATAQDGVLMPVPGSTRVVVQDTPAVEPPEKDRRRRGRDV
jgi:hypothetical protein